MAGLTPAPCNMVKPPRVKESPVVGAHVDDSIIKDGRIDTLAFKPVARLGYSEYTTTDNVWRMRRPDAP